MKEPTARGEPSNEEILASIRKVVSEQAEAEAAPAHDQGQDNSGILDLTQEIRDDGSVVDTGTGATVVEAEGEAPEEGLVDAETAAASSVAFAAIVETAAEPDSSSESAGKTIESAAKEVMRPMIKEWLDANLPELVERLVRREIERLSRRGESSVDR